MGVSNPMEVSNPMALLGMDPALEAILNTAALPNSMVGTRAMLCWAVLPGVQPLGVLEGTWPAIIMANHMEVTG